MSRLDLKISEIYGVSLSDTGSMRSSEADRPGVAISSLLLLLQRKKKNFHILTPTIFASATNEQVKHSVELGIFRLELFMWQQRKKAVNGVYA